MSDRYQREIEEILRQTGDGGSPKESGETGGTPLLARFSRMGRALGNRVYLNPGRLVFTGLALLLSAVLVSAIVPGLAGPVLWAGLILFILVYALFFTQPTPNLEKRWRGRVIDPHASRWSGESQWNRFQRWLKR